MKLMAAFAVMGPIFMFLIVLVRWALSAPQVPCFFIFGDSFVDNGNNNQLVTEAKANYPPYGIDFPEGPTGRFTNGLNTADVLANLLGFDTYIPSFLVAQGDEVIIGGVNYASGSAGIRSETGQQLGDRISLDRQLQNHNLTISRIARLLGNDYASAEEHLSKCLYYFMIGSNDYINNYYVPEYYPTSSIYTPEEYATVLVQQYSQQLRTMYEFGARKVVVSGLSLLGCIPEEVGRRGADGSSCVDSINDAVQLFNRKLQLLVDEFNSNLTQAEFIFTDLFALGISIASKPCCEVSNATGQCMPGLSPCHDRDLHVFYDNFHTTEFINKFLATAVYTDMIKLIH